MNFIMRCENEIGEATSLLNEVVSVFSPKASLSELSLVTSDIDLGNLVTKAYEEVDEFFFGVLFAQISSLLKKHIKYKSTATLDRVLNGPELKHVLQKGGSNYAEYLEEFDIPSENLLSHQVKSPVYAIIKSLQESVKHKNYFAIGMFSCWLHTRAEG